MENNNLTSSYISAIRSRIIKPKFRISFLNQNESIKNIVTSDVLKDGSNLSINYQQGTRRSLSLILDNKNGEYTPNENSRLLWFGSKLKLELGIELENKDIYWQSVGIFIVNNPVVDKKNKTISLQCLDKFSLLSGEIGGSLDGAYEIPVNTNIFKVMKDIIYADNGKGQPIDTKQILFDRDFLDVKTAYTITHASDSNFGAILIELANMIACDIYYNEDGNLVVESGISDVTNIQKPILWSFSEGDLEYNNPVVNYNFSGIKNRVIVVGTNPTTNVSITAISENRNPKSPIAIQKIGVKNFYIQDENISTDILAQNRADYELNKISMFGLSIDINSTFMIHLDVNKCIEITDSYYNLNNSKFVIQSLNIPLTNGSLIDIRCTNIVELPYFPGII